MKTVFAPISGVAWLLAALSMCSAGPIDSVKLNRESRPAVLYIETKVSSGTMQGTGFVVSADGKVATNHHVIAGASGANQISVRSLEGKEFRVKAIVADDGAHDLAILQLDATNMTALTLADDEPEMGAPVVVIGNPKGLEGSITDGIVSARRLSKRYGLLFQISAAVSHGSSGSPVLNAQGKVIGVATFIFEDGQALNFAVATSSLRDLLAHPRRVPVPDSPDLPSVSVDLPSEETRKQDAQVLSDPKFEQLRQLEKARTYPLMLESARNLAQRYPQSGLALRRLSDAYYYTAFLEDAVGASKKSLELDPTSGRGWNDLAIASAALKNEKAEMAAYREGLKVAPTDAKLWLEYGEKIRTSNPQAALDAIHTGFSFLKAGKGTDAESSSYALFAQAANSLLWLGKPDEAYDAALVGVKHDPKDPESWISMASAALAVKKYQHVRPYLEQGIACGGDQDILYGILADSEEEQGHLAAALDAWQRALRANGTNKDTLVNLVRVSLSRPTLTQAQWNEAWGYAEQLRGLDEKMGKDAADAVQSEFQRRQPR